MDPRQTIRNVVYHSINRDRKKIREHQMNLGKTPFEIGIDISSRTLKRRFEDEENCGDDFAIKINPRKPIRNAAKSVSVDQQRSISNCEYPRKTETYPFSALKVRNGT